MSWEVTRNIARKTETPEFFLDDPNCLIREGILDNPNTTEEILSGLIDDPSTNIREKLATKFLFYASRDYNWRVRYSAINDNPEVTEDILRLLACDTDMRVKKKAKQLLKINRYYVYRKNFNDTISIKLILPGSCNADCSFCYNKSNDKIEKQIPISKQKFLDNFLISLELIILKINGRQPISLDITGNEPTSDPEFFIKVLHKLRNFSLRDRISKITCTTNGTNLKIVAPFMREIVDYVNISVHDYRQKNRDNIFKTSSPTTDDYKEMVMLLLDNNIHTSAIAVIDEPIDNFAKFRDEFIKWADDDIGFVSLRLKDNVYKSNTNFLDYMMETIKSDKFFVIKEEKNPNLTFSQLSTKSGFFLYFLKGIIDTYEVSPGIDFFVHDDAKAYADFFKKIPFENYNFPVGYVFDKKQYLK